MTEPTDPAYVHVDAGAAEPATDDPGQNLPLDDQLAAAAAHMPAIPDDHPADSLGEDAVPLEDRQRTNHELDVRDDGTDPTAEDDDQEPGPVEPAEQEEG